MANFTDIIGQDAIRDHLIQAIEQNKISHAYIINGERCAGKEFIARIFAAALQCENSENRPCGNCTSCKQALSQNHPDIIRIFHEKPNSIGVDDVRGQLNGDIAIKPYKGPYKIYIMNEAEKMTQQAQNALLKTLEEPPAYAVILLLTTNMEALLPTIKSRCVTLNMKPVEDQLVKDFLMKEVQIPDYKAEVCAAFARGNIGRAKLLASSEEFDNIRNEAVSLLKNLDNMELGDLMRAIKNISEYQMDVKDYLDVLAIWYRDVLLFKATSDVNHLIFKDEIQYIKKVTDKSSYEGIEKIIKALETARNRLNANVNFDLTMELLFLTMKEN